ncbi:MAG: chemotaxis protein CheX [Chitinivibrionales bacterium]|nr:chemotaxis protein CheX [Chitinivibrionales bacterium]MBD3356885.1 chemotaxis protein CheX [Chitinivibrionales bacterium]
MDVAYVNPFIVAIRDTFNTMMGTALGMGEPLIKSEPYPTHDISGVIGLSGEARGSVTLSFPREVALKVVSKLLGVPVEEEGPELTDGIGELANIVAGNAKKGLTQYQMSLSLPNVIVGKDHALSTPADAPTVMVPFQCDLGELSMEVTLKGKS